MFELDKLKDECGVVGIYAPKDDSMSQRLCFGLVALQHRGQESAGIATSSNGSMNYYKDMGLVQDVFNNKILDHFNQPPIKELWIQCWANIMRNKEQIKPHLHGTNPRTYLGGNICLQCNNTSTNYINPKKSKNFQIFFNISSPMTP